MKLSRITMWIKHREDRAFLRDLARDIVADKAAEELGEFDTLVEHYFANPTPSIHPRSSRATMPLTVSSTPRLAEVAPAALIVVLNYLVIELEQAPQRAPIDGIKVGLKRLLRHGGSLPGEGIWLKAAQRWQEERLTVIAYAYLAPVGATVSTSALFEAAETAGHIYGLDHQQCAVLGNAVLARLCRYARRG
jgi:hypothetical protein